MVWWRNYIRKNTSPIHPARAMKMKSIFSTIYFVAAWNALSFGIYWFFTTSYPQREDEKGSPSKYYARLLATPEARVMKFEGFTLKEDYKLVATERLSPLEKMKAVQQEREKKSQDEDLKLLIEETSSL